MGCRYAYNVGKSRAEFDSLIPDHFNRKKVSSQLMTQPLYILVITQSRNNDLNKICARGGEFIIDTFDKVQTEANNRNRTHGSSGYVFAARLLDRKTCKAFGGERKYKDLWVTS